METLERYQLIFVSFGLLTLILAMLLWQGSMTGSAVEFVTGLLFGLAIVLNGVAIVGAARAASRPKASRRRGS